ncbi:hypothetical protein [Roseinatronobacter monicus]|uniref:Spore coat protein U-like protein n=1 Tax=Roseinatronobacter monicus TaxID=393481 RepID=A0A543K5T4_9RHOB|nr:hypothetical protein [Roseinatronobacter monicus]TQM90431.1 hypothetical protein BD293_3815 [Roseinatronobacter monicus]
MNVKLKLSVAAAAIMVSGSAFAEEVTYETTLNVEEPAQTCVVDHTGGDQEVTREVGENMFDNQFGSGQIEIVFGQVTLACEGTVDIDEINYEQNFSQSMIDAGMTGNVTLGRRLDPADEVSDVFFPNQAAQIVTRYLAEGFADYENNVIPAGQYVITNLFTIVYN